jgi:hypothetical protein
MARASTVVATRHKKHFLSHIHDELQRVGIDFDAEVWTWTSYFDEAEATNTTPIRWKEFMKPLASVKAESTNLEELFRTLAAILLTGCDGQAELLIPQSIKNILRDLRSLFLHFPNNRIPPLSTITPLQVQTAAKRMYFDSDGKPRVTKRSILSLIRSVRTLFIYAQYLPDALVLDPFPKKVAESFCRDASPGGGPRAAPPEPVCIELIRQAIRLLEEPAEDVIRMRSLYISTCEALRTADNVDVKDLKEHCRREIIRVFSGERFATVSGEESPWCATVPGKSLELHALVRVIQGACAVVLLFLAGPRLSELQRAGVGCLRHKLHDNGITYPYFVAARSKRRASAIRDKAKRPLKDRGWTIGPAGQRALEVLEQLSLPLREISGKPGYWTTHTSNVAWPYAKRPKFGNMSHSNFNKRLNLFARWTRVGETTGWSGRLHTSMGRAACARFIAKRDRSALGDIAVQFGHLSAYTTDYYYARPDAEYRRLVEDELFVEMKVVAADLAALNPANTFSNVDKPSLLAIRDRADHFLGQIASGSDVRRLLGAGTRLVPCDWGMCVYRQETSGCEGSEFGPSAERRSPIVCMKCLNFVATEKHRPFWERRVADCKKYLALRAMPEQTVLLMKERLREAETVLAGMGERV